LHQVTGFANQTYQVENCPAGQWEFRVQAIWQNGLGSPLSPVVYVSIFVPDAEYLIYQYVSSTAVQFSWHFPISALMPAGYNLYRNGQLWQYIPGSMTFGYLWQGVEAGVWTFYLRAVWVDGYESAPTDEVSITITGAEDATEVMPTSSVIACPNPFRTQVDFLLQEKHTAADKQIKIYNVRGQCIRCLTMPSETQGRIYWDGRDEKYQEVSTGLYFAVCGDRKDRIILKLLKY
jgi:hypothetical protein